MLALALLRSRCALAEAAAPRVVALDWTPAEMLLGLGVMPLGAPELDGYRGWVASPTLPGSASDVGLRSEPNLEAIAALKPDLIVSSTGFPPSDSVLSAIAPVFRVSIFGTGSPPLDAAATELTRLGAALGRQHAAALALERFGAAVEKGATALQAFRARPIYLASPADDRHVMVFGRSSLFGGVLERLRLANGWQGPSDGWGSETVGLDALDDPTGFLALVGGDAARMLGDLRASPTWRHLPAINSGSAGVLPPIWSFGGIAAATRLAEALPPLLLGLGCGLARAGIAGAA